jgi:predicted acylesterase/phospholipase RssA
MSGARKNGTVKTDAALWQEYDEVERRRLDADLATNGPYGPETVAGRSRRLSLTALCLSGGGNRSAAFCLGVLQSLAKKRRLNDFDYLSTVSGGGFIGGWLQVLMRESGDIDSAQKILANNLAPPTQRLRGFTNYLTPQTGPFSADTWAAIVLYLRNLILNWMRALGNWQMEQLNGESLDDLIISAGKIAQRQVDNDNDRKTCRKPGTSLP